MLIRTLKLEKKAQKAFKNDLSDGEESTMDYPERFCQKWPHLAAQNKVCDSSVDELYMGGQSEKNKRSQNSSRKQQKQGCFDKLISMSGSGQNNFGKSDPKHEWDNMSDKQKEERVEQLWQKARRYNNKLRF